MIISASYRTDIPAFYGTWFRHRLAAGYCRSVNPYGGQISDIALTKPAVDGFVFWTRNARPFFDALDEVRDRTFPFVVHVTLTGYPHAIDAATIGAENAVDQVRSLRDRFGRRAVVWRYDPILLTSVTPAAWHLENFTRLATQIGNAVDEVVFSFAQIYRKTARNMETAAQRHGFSWWDPPAEEKIHLLAELAGVAENHGISASLCAQRELLIDGVGDAACVDVMRLSDVAGYPIKAARHPHRERCGCWASRDIGAYDTCPHGCAYCYAVGKVETAKRRYREHDPDSPFLFAPQKMPEAPTQGDLFS